MLPRPLRLLNVLLQEQASKEVTQSIWQQNIPGYTMYGVFKKLKLIELNTKHLHRDKRIEAIREKVTEHTTTAEIRPLQPQLNKG